MNTVLVTGASRGIGRATALLAAERGWPVAINYRNDAKAAADTAAEVQKRGAPVTTVRGDVSVEADVVAMFAKAQADLGPLGGVVINAGITAPAMRLADMSAERLEKMFKVNVLGAYLCAREAARAMARSRGGKGGSVVLISSGAARLGSPGTYVDYAGSKAALDTLAIGLGKELGPDGVRVNAIRPGLIETEIHATTGDPDRARKLGAGTPLGRAGKPEEIAAAVIWLLSDAASYITGSVLDITGGI
ncbi:MAG TPA: SDR family oxidoreductase [Steroidobacteraceae bacterium]|jgi:NAD(P)-dependent dehydrogenase (short-subunit alcohol dehydrogenase family)